MSNQFADFDQSPRGSDYVLGGVVVGTVSGG